jgi:hypothetical protein
MIELENMEHVVTAQPDAAWILNDDDGRRLASSIAVREKRVDAAGTVG